MFKKLSIAVLQYKAQLNDAKRIADRTKERGKELLLQAQKLSGLTSNDNIPSEKQQVRIVYFCVLFILISSTAI